jgi:hypothetical protein
MHTRLLTALAATALLAVLPSTARADADACAADPAPSKCYMTAAAALKDTKPGEAAALYLKAYRIEPKIDPLAGYGTSLALDKQYVLAAEVLEKAAEDYEKVRAQLEKSNSDANTLFQVIHRLEYVREEINKLVPKIGKVQLKVVDKQLPPGVTVMRKNGSDLRGADSTLLFVTANSDILVFTYPSGRTAELEVNVPAGTISSVPVPTEPPLPQAAPPPPPPPVDEAAPLRTKGYVAGGAGAALVLFGFGYVIAADSPSAAVTGAVIGVGFVGIGVGAYFLWKASKKDKEQKARTGPTPPAPAREDAEDEESAFVPLITDQMVGAAVIGSF